MKVFERFTRKGDQLLYEVTVEDPQVLLQPWELKPMLMSTATAGAGWWRRPRRYAGLIGAERGDCQEEELDDIANQIRH